MKKSFVFDVFRISFVKGSISILNKIPSEYLKKNKTWKISIRIKIPIYQYLIISIYGNSSIVVGNSLTLNSLIKLWQSILIQILKKIKKQIKDSLMWLKEFYYYHVLNVNWPTAAISCVLLIFRDFLFFFLFSCIKKKNFITKISSETSRTNKIDFWRLFGYLCSLLMTLKKSSPIWTRILGRFTLYSWILRPNKIGSFESRLTNCQKFSKRNLELFNSTSNKKIRCKFSHEAITF